MSADDFDLNSVLSKLGDDTNESSAARRSFQHHQHVDATTTNNNNTSNFSWDTTNFSSTNNSNNHDRPVTDWSTPNTTTTAFGSHHHQTNPTSVNPSSTLDLGSGMSIQISNAKNLPTSAENIFARYSELRNTSEALKNSNPDGSMPSIHQGNSNVSAHHHQTHHHQYVGGGDSSSGRTANDRANEDLLSKLLGTRNAPPSSSSVASAAAGSNNRGGFFGGSGGNTPPNKNQPVVTATEQSSNNKNVSDFFKNVGGSGTHTSAPKTINTSSRSEWPPAGPGGSPTTSTAAATATTSTAAKESTSLSLKMPAPASSSSLASSSTTNKQQSSPLVSTPSGANDSSSGFPRASATIYLRYLPYQLKEKEIYSRLVAINAKPVRCRISMPKNKDGTENVNAAKESKEGESSSSSTTNQQQQPQQLWLFGFLQFENSEVARKAALALDATKTPYLTRYIKAEVARIDINETVPEEWLRFEKGLDFGVSEPDRTLIEYAVSTHLALKNYSKIAAAGTTGATGTSSKKESAASSPKNPSSPNATLSVPFPSSSSNNVSSGGVGKAKSEEGTTTVTVSTGDLSSLSSQQQQDLHTHVDEIISKIEKVLDIKSTPGKKNSKKTKETERKYLFHRIFGDAELSTPNTFLNQVLVSSKSSNVHIQPYYYSIFTSAYNTAKIKKEVENTKIPSLLSSPIVGGSAKISALLDHQAKIYQKLKTAVGKSLRAFSTLMMMTKNATNRNSTEVELIQHEFNDASVLCSDALGAARQYLSLLLATFNGNEQELEGVLANLDEETGSTTASSSSTEPNQIQQQSSDYHDPKNVLARMKKKEQKQNFLRLLTSRTYCCLWMRGIDDVITQVRIIHTAVQLLSSVPVLDETSTNNSSWKTKVAQAVTTTQKAFKAIPPLQIMRRVVENDAFNLDRLALNNLCTLGLLMSPVSSLISGSIFNLAWSRYIHANDCRLTKQPGQQQQLGDDAVPSFSYFPAPSACAEGKPQQQQNTRREPAHCSSTTFVPLRPVPSMATVFEYHCASASTNQLTATKINLERIMQLVKLPLHSLLETIMSPSGDTFENPNNTSNIETAPKKFYSVAPADLETQIAKFNHFGQNVCKEIVQKHHPTPDASSASSSNTNTNLELLSAPENYRLVVALVVLNGFERRFSEFATLPGVFSEAVVRVFE